MDSYETPFGVRTLKYDPNAGFFLNGEHIKINGVCDHTMTLGLALGSAVNYPGAAAAVGVACRDMGCNASNPHQPQPARARRNCWTYATRWASW